MRRGLILSFLLLLVGVVSAASLGEMRGAIEAMGSYEVSFSVSLDEMTIGGGYRVDGERYHLVLEGEEIWGDAHERVSVNHTMQEVVVEHLDDDSSLSPIVVVDPVRAFTSLEEIFDVELIEDQSGVDITALRLTPKVAGGQMESSILNISNSTNLPTSIVYEVGGDRLIVEIEHFVTSQTPLVTPQYPSSYEIFDLR